MENTYEVYVGKRKLGEEGGDGLRGKRVFLRVDFNVSLDGVGDDSKIRKTVPTIHALVDMGVERIVVGTHLGRPECDEDPEERPSDGGVRPLVERLNAAVQREGVCFEFTFMTRDDVGKRWVVVQNLRTLRGEKDAGEAGKCTREFFDAFVRRNCDVMVNDAFGVMHRRDHSVVGVQLERIAGLLVDAEIEGLRRMERPVGREEKGEKEEEEEKEKEEEEEEEKEGRAARVMEVRRVKNREVCGEERELDLLIIGGSKLQDKISLIKKLSKRSRRVFVTGRLSIPFEQGAPEVQEILRALSRNGTGLFLPVDYVLADGRTVDAGQADESARDIGAETRALLEDVFARSERVFWNGTFGKVEEEQFRGGTAFFISLVRARKARGEGGFVAVGGGDTAGFVNSTGESEWFDLVSTGGGVSLEMLEGKVLPGIAALSDKASAKAKDKSK